MCVAALVVSAAGQAPTFEVASIKRSTPGVAKSLGGPQRGHFLTSGTLRQLIQEAYRRGGYEVRTVSGGPKWMDSDRFDIQATVDPGLSLSALYLPDGKGSAGLAYVMLRALLADRFKLAVHTETRQLPIYALTIAHAGALGPELHRSTVDCDAVLAEMARTGRPVPPAAAGQAPPCSTQTAKGRVAATDMTMTQLAEVLSPAVERDVRDRTRLGGAFTFKLEWTDDLSIFTAIQEQLGLKLEPGSGPIDVIVVDRAEPPTPD
jgi:uncharacterized protein (TIGR03435 family)